MSQTPGKNPYRPGVGLRPTFLAGRDRDLRLFDKVLSAAPEIPANIRLTGVRGVGKSVLLTEFEDRARSDPTKGGLNWAVGHVDCLPEHIQTDLLIDRLEVLMAQTKRAASRAAEVRARIGAAALAVTSVVRANWNDIELSLNTSGFSRQQSMDLSKVLYDTTAACLRAGRSGFLLTLDEAQILRDERDSDGEHPLSLLLTVVSGLQLVGVPVGIVLCGLPTLKTNLQKARSYSERMFRGVEIGSLQPEDAIEAFVRPLDDTGRRAAPELRAMVIEETERYPFFIQLWGAELWDAATDAGVDEFSVDLLTAIEDDIYRRLDSDFYDPRFESLAPAEQDVLLATSQITYPPIRTADLHKATTKTPGNVNVLLGQLTEAGVIYRSRKGEYLYTAPKFADYLRRRVKARS